MPAASLCCKPGPARKRPAAARAWPRAAEPGEQRRRARARRETLAAAVVADVWRSARAPARSGNSGGAVLGSGTANGGLAAVARLRPRAARVRGRRWPGPRRGPRRGRGRGKGTGGRAAPWEEREQRASSGAVEVASAKGGASGGSGSAWCLPRGRPSPGTAGPRARTLAARPAGGGGAVAAAVGSGTSGARRRRARAVARAPRRPESACAATRRRGQRGEAAAPCAWRAPNGNARRCRVERAPGLQLRNVADRQLWRGAAGARDRHRRPRRSGDGERRERDERGRRVDAERPPAGARRRAEGRSWPGPARAPRRAAARSASRAQMRARPAPAARSGSPRGPRRVATAGGFAPGRARRPRVAAARCES